MEDASFPCVFPSQVHQRTAIESSAIKWADVDFGGRDDPRGALDAVRWHSRGDGRKHFLRVQWPSGDLVTYALRDASFARLLRDVFRDPQLDPPGKQIVLRNGTSEPFKMPRKDGKPSLGRLVSWCRFGVPSKEDPGDARGYGQRGTKDPYIIEAASATWKRMSEEDIDDMIERFQSEAGGGASSQASVTTSPAMPAAIASAGSPPAASAPSDAGMILPTRLFPLEREHVEQPAQSARSGENVRANLSMCVHTVSLGGADNSPVHISALDKARAKLPEVINYQASSRALGGGGADGGGSGGRSIGASSQAVPWQMPAGAAGARIPTATTHVPRQELERDRKTPQGKAARKLPDWMQAKKPATGARAAKRKAPSTTDARLDHADAQHADGVWHEAPAAAAGGWGGVGTTLVTQWEPAGDRTDGSSARKAATREPGPASSSAPLALGSTLADEGGQAAATDGGLGHDCDCDKEDCDPAVGVDNRRKASLIQGPGPSGAAARGAPVVTTIRDEPIAHNAGTKPVISLAQRKQNLREGKG